MFLSMPSLRSGPSFVAGNAGGVTRKFVVCFRSLDIKLHLVCLELKPLGYEEPSVLTTMSHKHTQHTIYVHVYTL